MAIQGETQALTLTAEERTCRFTAFCDAGVPRSAWSGVWHRGRIHKYASGDMFGTEEFGVAQVTRTAAQMAPDVFTATIGDVSVTATGAHIIELLALAGDYYRRQDLDVQTAAAAAQEPEAGE